jgi:putative ABC transport system permease protein
MRHILSLALKNIVVHPLRSVLTILGIFLGVASVIVMLAVGEAARYKAIQQIKELGATNIIVRSIKPEELSKQQQGAFRLTYGLTMADMHRIHDTIPTVLSVTPLREFRKDVRHLEHKLEARVVSVMPNYRHLTGLKLASGRFITDVDNLRYDNVAVLGAQTAEKLFPFDNPIGNTVRIVDGYYRVVGVMARRAPSAGIGGSMTSQDFNKDVYIPFRTDAVRFGKTLSYHRAGTYEFENLEISQLTIAVDSMDHVKKTADIIGSVLNQFHKQKDTAITVPLDLLEKAEQTQRLFTLVLGAIASISLLVGGVGIMNIMLATVTERTKEIGIRRALGAKRRDIARQFMVEAVVLSSTGGLLGICLGIGLSFIVGHVLHLPTIIRPWSPLVAVAVAVAVGLLFGTYPAWRAARMDPIEALRHE